MQNFLFRLILGAASVIVLAVISGCVFPGMGDRDKSLGYNGSYEIAKSRLPVNWTFSRYPIKRGDAEVSLDTMDAIDGDQSLKFVVHRIAEGRFGVPFLFQVRTAEPSAKYAVSFWLKNQGCTVQVEIGYEGKDPLFGLSDYEKQDYASHPPIRKVLGDDETGNDQWRQFRYSYTVPETDGRLRFQLAIRRPFALHTMRPSMGPCTLWIDDVRVEQVAASGVPVTISEI